MRATCPNCGRSGRLPDTVTTRKKVRCPACNTLFPVDPVQAYELMPAADAIAPPPPVVEPPIFGPNVVVAVEDRRPTHVSVSTPLPRKGNALAVASLVIGIIAACVCWVPLLGVVAMPLAAVGCILGVPGVLLSLPRSRSGFPAAAMGLLLSVGSAAFAYHMTNRTVDHLRAAMKPAPQAVAKAVKADQPRRAAVAPAAPPSAPPEEWVVAPGPAQLGAIVTRLPSAKVSPVQFKDIGADTYESKDAYLVIEVDVSNASANKKATYRTWGDLGSMFTSDDDAKLADNFGNTYRLISFGITSNVVGRVKAGSIYPGKAIVDVLVFEPPVDGIAYLDLTLPAGNVGESGVYRFRINAGSIER